MASRYSIVTGKWSEIATWDGAAAVPAAADIVEIRDGTVVTVDVEIEAIGKCTIKSGGKLIIAFDMALSAFDDIVLESGSQLTYTSGTFRCKGDISRISSGGGSCGVAGIRYWLGM